MKIFTKIIFLLFFVSSGLLSQRADSLISLHNLKLLVLKAMQKDDLKELDLLASFKNTKGQDIFLFEGQIQSATYMETSMFIVHYLRDTDSLDIGKYSLPGKGYDFMDTLVYEARVFYGHCLDKYPCSIIWHQNTRMQNGGWEKDYFILDVSSDKFKSFRYNARKIDLKSILKNLSDHKCFELRGTEAKYEP